MRATSPSVLRPTTLQSPLHSNTKLGPSISAFRRNGGTITVLLLRPICIDGSELDAAMSKSELLTRSHVLKRRYLRLKQLARIYLYYYWAFMEEMRSEVREYYWDYGKSAFVEEEETEWSDLIRIDGAGLSADN